MGWGENKSVRLILSAFADEFVNGKSAEGLESLGEVMDGDEVAELSLQLIVAVVAADGGVLDCPVHAFDLSVGPGMIRFCQPMFDAVQKTDPIKRMPRSTGCSGTTDRGCTRRSTISAQLSSSRKQTPKQSSSQPDRDDVTASGRKSQTSMPMRDAFCGRGNSHDQRERPPRERAVAACNADVSFWLAALREPERAVSRAAS